MYMTKTMITKTVTTITTTEAPTVVRTRGLELRPAGDATVCVFPENLRIARDERWVLTGPSGCGKTTLVNALCGLLAPSAGDLEILGQDIYRMSSGERDRFRGRRLGVVHQEFHLLNGFNAVENLMTALRFSAGQRGFAARKQAGEMLEAAGLSNRATTRVERLSRGEAQRVSVARALAHRPELLITDEPTASLDSERSAAMLDWIDQLRVHSGCAWICVTHDPSVVSRFDHQINASNWARQEMTG